MSPRPGRAWLVWLAVAFGLASYAASAWLPYSFLKGDSAFYVTMDRALLDSGWLEMSAYHPMSWYKGGLPHYREMDAGWSNLALGADGVSYYPKHPWLIAVFSLPLYALFGNPGVLLFNILAAAIIVTAAYVVARRFAGPTAALAALVPVVLSGLMLENTYTFSNDIFYTALLGLGLIALLGRNHGVSAFFFACAVVAKPTNLLWLPVPFVAIAWEVMERWRAGNHRALFPPPSELLRPMLAPAVATGAVALVAAAMNTIMFGSPLRGGYHSIVVAHHGEISVKSATAAFNQPFWAGLLDQINNRWQGLWPRGLVLGVGAGAGLLGLRRVGPVALLPLLVLLTYLGVHAKFDYVWARFYLPCLLLTPLGLAAAFARPAEAVAVRGLRTRRAVGIVSGAALLVWLLGVGVGALLQRPGGRFDLADVLTSATVTRTERGRTTPCDYLNPNTQHWECSRLEGQYWEGWGTDIRHQCAFDRWASETTAMGGTKAARLGQTPAKAVRDLLFIAPAAVGVKKRMVFNDLGPLKDLSLLLGYARGSRGMDAKITVTLNGQPVALPKIHRASTLHLVALGDKANRTGPNRLEIEVEATTSHSWRQVCLGAWLSRAE